MTRNNPVIGVTGSTGSGKTTVAKILAGCGGAVIDADELSHQVIMPGKPAYEAILARFGAGILSESGAWIDRKKLGAIVFSAPEALDFLENTVHPQVTAETLAVLRRVESGEVRAMNGKPAAFAVIDAVLLIESGMDRYCSSLWLVTAPEVLKYARILSRDGLTPVQAEQRIKNQRDEKKLVPLADVIIHNDSGLESLEEKTRAAFERFTAEHSYKGLRLC